MLLPIFSSERFTNTLCAVVILLHATSLEELEEMLRLPDDGISSVRFEFHEGETKIISSGSYHYIYSPPPAPGFRSILYIAFHLRLDDALTQRLWGSARGPSLLAWLGLDLDLDHLIRADLLHTHWNAWTSDKSHKSLGKYLIANASRNLIKLSSSYSNCSAHSTSKDVGSRIQTFMFRFAF